MSEAMAGEGELRSIPVTEGALQALEKTRGWVKFLGILSIIVACLMSFMFLVALVTLSAKGLASLLFVIEAAVFTVVTIFYAIYWLGYANSLRRLATVEGSLDEMVTDALVRQRRLWAFQGILFIVAITLSILAAIIMPYFIWR